MASTSTRKSPKKSGGIDRIFRQIISWVQTLFGKKHAKYQPPKILKEYSSTLTRLLLIERDTPRAVRTWRSVPKNAEHDILITCDHLGKVPGEMMVEKGHAQATHRLSVLRMSRIPGPKGSRKVVQIWCGDFNWVNALGGTVDGNRYAIVITDALAKQLLGVPDTEVDWSWEVLQYTKEYVGTTGYFIYPSLQPTEESPVAS